MIYNKTFFKSWNDLVSPTDFKHPEEVLLLIAVSRIHNDDNWNSHEDIYSDLVSAAVEALNSAVESQVYWNGSDVEDWSEDDEVSG